MAVAEVENNPWKLDEAFTKRLLVKKLVVVAAVVVENCAVKDWRVVEPVTKRLVRLRVVALMFVAKTSPSSAVLARKSVVEAMPETKNCVAVAF